MSTADSQVRITRAGDSATGDDPGDVVEGVNAPPDTALHCIGGELPPATGGDMVLLSSDLGNPDAIPYFLWDDPVTVAEFRRLLEHGPPDQRLHALAKLLREARDEDVWHFVTPQRVADVADRLYPLLGRRRAFWEYLLGAWKELGLLE